MFPRYSIVTANLACSSRSDVRDPLPYLLLARRATWRGRLQASGRSTPEVDDMSPTPHPENIPRDVACVINTHLHFDHCGGNRLFPGVPIHVQARELADARSLDPYTIREWVDFDGATYVEHEGEVELLPGIRLLPAPGHTDGHQVVVVETDAGTNVLGGDVGVWFGELESGTTEGQRRVLALGAPTWLAHEPGPKVPERRP
jgi:N-acyl homoserine lactone hydrolase